MRSRWRHGDRPINCSLGNLFSVTAASAATIHSLPLGQLRLRRLPLIAQKRRTQRHNPALLANTAYCLDFQRPALAARFVVAIDIVVVHERGVPNLRYRHIRPASALLGVLGVVRWPPHSLSHLGRQMNQWSAPLCTSRTHASKRCCQQRRQRGARRTAATGQPYCCCCCCCCCCRVQCSVGDLPLTTRLGVACEASP
jgi:hypothetical protein